MTNDDSRTPSPDDRTPDDQEGVAPEAAPDEAPDAAPDADESPVAPPTQDTAPLSSEPQNPWGTAWGTPPADSLNPYGTPSSPPSGSPETPASGAPEAPPTWQAAPPPPSAEGPAAAQPPAGPPGETPPPPVSGGLYGDAPSAPPAYPVSGGQYGAPPPPPPQGGYGGYGAPPSYGAAGVGGSRQNVLAIVSLVAGILAIPCCGCFIFGITAAITGFLARKQIAASNGAERGDGMALAGLALGVVSILLGILVTILQVSGVIDTTYNFDTP